VIVVVGEEVAFDGVVGIIVFAVNYYLISCKYGSEI
jgi:hypothetical protein